MDPGYPVTPLPPGCPWSTFAPPHIKYCEENLCSWIVAPSNTWSNLGYIIIGIWLWKKLAREKTGLVTLFGPAILGTGIASFAYHASYTFMFQVLDFMGMYLFSGLLLTLNLVRLNWVSRRLAIPTYAACVLAGTLPFLVTSGAAGRSIFGIQVGLSMASEIYLFLRSRAAGLNVNYAPYWKTLGIFVVAYSAWWIDTGNIWCIPSNHLLQGHAVWHLTNAFCFVTIATFYRQFKTLT